MNSFSEFIENDIVHKKELLQTMPLNTKNNIAKYNDKLNLIYNKYAGIQDSLLKYMKSKTEEYEIENDDKGLLEIKENIQKIEDVLYYLNPGNTPFEKCGFGDLFYRIKYYNKFNFDYLHKTIIELYEKFRMVGVNLNPADFFVTPYVKQYMTAFLKDPTEAAHVELSNLFEKIYWANPEIMKHIGLNFRILITRNEKAFVNYIMNKQQTVIQTSGITSYNDAIERLKVEYQKMIKIDKETMKQIVDFAKSGDININNYLKESRVKDELFEKLIIGGVNYEDKDQMKKVYSQLNKLKMNLEEYISYQEFLPLIDYFKKEYHNDESVVSASAVKQEAKKKENIEANVKAPKDAPPVFNLAKEIADGIKDKEEKLQKISDSLQGKTKVSFFKKFKQDPEKLTAQSIDLSNELNILYRKKDNERIKRKVLTIIEEPVVVADVLEVYYNFDYLKKDAFYKVGFAKEGYADLVERCKDFDEYALRPTHIILETVPLLKEHNIKRVMVDNYRINGINITEEELANDDLYELLNQVKMLLRLETIDNSSITAEDIWFICQVDRILKTKNGK